VELAGAGRRAARGRAGASAAADEEVIGAICAVRAAPLRQGNQKRALEEVCDAAVVSALGRAEIVWAL
jgi:hypothetical protein